MNNYSFAAETIKNSVSSLDVAEALGLEVKHGRCRCPIHGGNDFNCRLYPGNRGYMCWVCKSAGDVIKLIQESQHCSFKDSVAWFNGTFHMGLDLDGRMDRESLKQAENAQIMRKRAIAFQEWKERKQFDLALVADRIVEILEEQRDRNVPKTPGEEWNEKFCEAVRLLPEAREFAEECMADCMKENK